MLQVGTRISIPDDELQFTFARSSGPGGQNVNKVNSKAVLRWSVTGSTSLPEDVRQRFLVRYRSRLTTDGELVIACQESRDQARNIDGCRKKLREMLSAVATAPRKRRPTKPTRSSVVRRKESKRQQSKKKQLRRKPADD